MMDLLASWIPGLFLLAVLAGAAWGAIGVSSGSPGWGSIRNFLGLFGLGGALAGYLPVRAFRVLLELAGLDGGDLSELPLGLRSGVDLIWAGMDQGLQLALLGFALQATLWPRRAALRAAVALGLGSIFWRTTVGIYSEGAAALAPAELATQLFGAGAAALLLGSLFGVGHKLAAWLAATLAIALATWGTQSLPGPVSSIAGLALLFAADRLLWSWRVGESEGVERLYPLWRASYEVHRQCSAARRLVRLWTRISWRERIFRALGSWLPTFVALALAAGLPALLVVLATGRDGWELLTAAASGAFLSVGGLGLAWAATGGHALRNPQWAFLAGLDRPETGSAEEWRRREVTFLCVVLVGLACGLAAAA
jgi:hypothetical protein